MRVCVVAVGNGRARGRGRAMGEVKRVVCVRQQWGSEVQM